jgi:transcriptional regulator with XRE-family HTH domain
LVRILIWAALGRENMTNSHWSEIVNSIDNLPVFEGMEKVGLTGKDIADVVGVSPPTVSKWRNGKSRVPGDVVALLTLVLGNRIEELQNWFSSMSTVPGNWQFQARAGMDSALDDLQSQERLNKALSRDDVREGAKRFRHWWVAKGKLASGQIVLGGNEIETRQSGF